MGEEGEGLKFAKVAWSYHDGWSWSQTQATVTEDEEGNKTPGTTTSTFHHRGHVHLFLPTVPFSKNGSSLAYSGEQTYSFSVVDEWGPNSNDPSQNMSVKLIGKPIWHVYVEEYWRRFYAQPWDVVDETCELPLNQEIEYESMTLEDYYDRLVSNAPVGNAGRTADLHYTYSDYDSGTGKYINGSILELTGAELDGRWDTERHFSDTRLGYNDYLERVRRRNARQYYARNGGISFREWLIQKYFSDGCVKTDPSTGELMIATTYAEVRSRLNDNENLSRTLELSTTSKTITLKKDIPDELLLEFVYETTETTEDVTVTNDDGSTTTRTVTTTVSNIDSFEEFYRLSASRYGGYADNTETLEEYLQLQRISKDPRCKQGPDNTINVPTGRTVGHVGIRFDASKPCHSLGPFVEGGEFYFFATAVNRTLPCEYWLDEDMRTRQHLLKQRSDGYEETTGDQKWTFSADASHFVWVADMFSEASRLLGDSYEDDEWSDGWTYYGGGHRVQNLYSEERHHWHGWNAKRLKNDRSVKLDNGEMHSDNSKVIQNRYSDSAQVVDSSSDDGEPKQVVYTDTGWHYADPSPAPERPTVETIRWEDNGWTGWYELGETVRCAQDERWYRRGWAPMRYSPASRFSGEQPYWTVGKRQHFPNPPPWLCDSGDGTPRYNGDSSKLPCGLPYARHHFCTTSQYASDEDNRIHLLQWEYAMYFGLVRTYPRGFDGDESTLRRHVFAYVYTDDSNESPTLHLHFATVSSDGTYRPPRPGETPAMETPADIETFMEEEMERHGSFTSFEQEHSAFMEWISTLGDAWFSRYEDRDVMWRQDEYTGRQVEILASDIRQGGMYATYDWDGNETLHPLPDPEYNVAYGTDNAPVQTYLQFAEFASVWTPLPPEEERALGGDMPQRNTTPYPFPETAEDAYPELSSDFDPATDETGRHHNAVIKNEHGDIVSGTDNPVPYNEDELQAKRNAYNEMKSHLLDESAPSQLCSAFYPRIDNVIQTHNDGERNVPYPGQPKLPLYIPSPLDEYGSPDDLDTLEEKQPQKGTFLDTFHNGKPFDPYRNGTVNPMTEWKKYFSHMEMFTIPERTTVASSQSTASAGPHPRETSYCHEDGARRHYPDGMYMSPVMEYQKIIRRDWERLPGKEQEEAFLERNWKTDREGKWGDGFDITIKIPWKMDEEVMSPFSDSDNITKPIGEYCHDAVKPEDMMRHHIEFYDSLDQVRKYDYPSYIDMIRDFQRKTIPLDENGNPPPLPEGEEPVPFYFEDFNDWKATREMRADRNDPGLIQFNAQRERLGSPPYGTWNDALDEYWQELNDPENNPLTYINTPVTSDRDSKWNPKKENSFATLKDGTKIWREQVTHLMPSSDKVEWIEEEVEPGYIDSKGNHVKGGGRVKFSNPFAGKDDGRWYEECLGAVVRARCTLILEDALGYRWKQVVDATALQPDQPLRGRDYDG